MRYAEYLASREWALRREAVRRRSGNKCERCKRGPQDAVHHLTYANVGNEPLEDLQAICHPCHEFLSGKSHQDPVSLCAEQSLEEILEACDLAEEAANQAHLCSRGACGCHWPINYCRIDCDVCGKDKLGIFNDPKMWDCQPEEFSNYNHNYGTFCINGPGEVRCDGCGTDVCACQFSLLLIKGAPR